MDITFLGRCLSINEGIPSQPELNFGFKVDIILLISCGHVG